MSPLAVKTPNRYEKEKRFAFLRRSAFCLFLLLCCPAVEPFGSNDHQYQQDQ